MSCLAVVILGPLSEGAVGGSRLGECPIIRTTPPPTRLCRATSP